MCDHVLRQSDLPAVFGLLDQMMSSDPFSAMAPFATGAARSHKGRQCRPMALDVVETHKGIELHADVPGLPKEDIQLQVEDSVLTLSAGKKHEAHEEKKGDGETWHHYERSHQFGKRSLRLPEYADTDNIKASYENGVLKVEIPKKAVSEKKKTIAIC